MGGRTSITIKEIARELGVSKSTVSRALHDSSEISQETKDRVMALVQQREYSPNPMAVSLLKSRSNSIGVLVPEIANPFFASVISGIEEVAYRQGYYVAIYQSHEDQDREIINVRHAYNRRLDGLIVSMSAATRSTEHFTQLHQRGFRLVFFDRVCEDLDVPKVVVDDFDGAYRATQHLIEQGCRRIAHIGGPDQLAIARKRLYGYRAALSDYSLPIREEYEEKCSFRTEEAIRLTDRLLSLPEPPDGIFAASDRIALGAHYALRQQGLKIPHDVALIGFTDAVIAPLLDPPLSSIAQPAHEMGQSAAELLISQIENPEASTVLSGTRILRTNLIPRASSVRKIE